jgi:hypothetical protein
MKNQESKNYEDLAKGGDEYRQDYRWVDGAGGAMNTDRITGWVGKHKRLLWLLRLVTQVVCCLV